MTYYVPFSNKLPPKKENLFSKFQLSIFIASLFGGGQDVAKLLSLHLELITLHIEKGKSTGLTFSLKTNQFCAIKDVYYSIYAS